LLGCLLNPLEIIGYIRGSGLRFKNIKMLFIQIVSINIKPFTLELIRAERVILYLFFNKVYRTVKYLPPISRLRLIFNRLIIYPRQESCPRVPCFLTTCLGRCITLLRSLLGLLCEVLNRRGLCV
jgi:hypothetical protein